MPLCQEYTKKIPKETLWLTFRYLSDPDLGKISLKSLQKSVELVFGVNPEDCEEKYPLSSSNLK